VSQRLDGEGLTAMAVIPARFASQRLPGKPLLEAGGAPLIRHVWDRVQSASRVRRVIVATDDQRISDAVRDFGGEAVMTSSVHETGTDRIGELLPILDTDVVLNVQGDEPELDPEVIDRLVGSLEQGPELGACTAACPFPEDEDPTSPDAVKVVTDACGRALYFSRSLIPGSKSRREDLPTPWPLLHLGVYAYRREVLEAFVGSERGSLEAAESLEQLRLLELGIKMGVVMCDRAPAGVDTPADFEAFRARLEGETGE